MKKMKRVSILTLICMLIGVFALAIAACGEEKIDGISVSADTPMYYVAGSELDLGKSKLTVTTGETTKDIAFSEGVTVEGYDKDKLGKQELTVTYNGKTATFTVTVSERLAVTDAETSYLVGQDFNPNKGHVTYAENGVKPVSKPLNDSAVKITGFDSSTAGEKTVTVSYSGATAVLKVTVYDVANIAVKFPNKTVYSHETELNLSGCYLTVSNERGDVQQQVVLTKDMIGDYDLSVGKEYMDEPCKETVEVTYKGKTATFTINVYYSGVSLVRDAAKALSSLDWSHEGTYPAITEEQGEIALEAAECLVGLRADWENMISFEDVSAVVRAAAVYGNRVWQEDFDSYNSLDMYKGVFLFKETATYAGAKADYEKLSAHEGPVFTVGRVLADVRELYGDIGLFTEETSDTKKPTSIEDYLEDVYDPDGYDANVLRKLKLMTDLYDALKDVPDYTTIESFGAYQTQVESARELFVSMSDFIPKEESNANRYLFGIVNSWRADEGYFEVLYRYYYELYTSKDDVKKAKAQTAFEEMINIYLPGVLEDFYQSLLLPAYEYEALQYSQGFFGEIDPAEEIDTFWFIRACNDIDTAKADVEQAGGMYADLYKMFGMDQNVEMVQSLRDGFSLYLRGTTTYDRLWREYFEAIDLLYQDNPDESALYASVERMFKDFVNATPTVQMGFLASLNAYLTPEFYPSDGTGRGTTFTYLLVTYCSKRVGDDVLVSEDGGTVGIAANLLVALQEYTLRNNTETAEDGTDDFVYLNAFLETMETVKEQYNALTGEMKSKFDTHLGFLYTKYVDIYEKFNEDKKYVQAQADADSILAEWMAKFDELSELLQESMTAELFIEALGMNELLPMWLSATEKAEALATEILNCDIPAVLEYFTHVTVTLEVSVTDENGNSTGETEEQEWGALEYIYYSFRSYYVAFLTAYPDEAYSGTYDLWNYYYNSPELRAFMRGNLHDYLWWSTDGDDKLEESALKEKEAELKTLVLNVEKEFRALGDLEKDLFLVLDGNGTFAYYTALKEYYKNVFTEDKDGSAVLNEAVNNVAVALLNLERDLIVKYGGKDEETVAAAEAAKKAVKEAYEALSEEDKAIFDGYLSEMYNYYLGTSDETVNP